MIKFLTIFTAFFLTLGFTLYASEIPVKTATDEIQVIAVKMDAGWCGKCKVMNPRLDNVMPEFMGEDILFLKFNMTDDFTIHQTELMAERLNLSTLFEEHKETTGFMVLLDANTGETLHSLTSDQSEEELIRDIRATLASVQS